MWFFISDTFYPGWHLFIDGKKRKIHKVNYTFMGFPIGKGNHSLYLVYSPLSIKIGLIITFLTIVLYLGSALDTGQKWQELYD